MPTYIRKTSNYTANVGDYIIADTSSGPFTITLPASPSTGDFVAIADGSNWTTNILTVARNGSTIEGLSDDIDLDVNGVQVEFVYDSTTWEIFIFGYTIEPIARRYVSQKTRYDTAEQFKESFSETNASVGYVFIGKHLPWDSENNPETITDTVSSEKYVWNNLIAAKKATGNDVELVILKNTWAANNRYNQFDDQIMSQTLLSTVTSANLYPMYIINSERNVYKCLSNNSNSISTIEPTGVNSGNKGIIQTADGYLWKYMYNIQPSNKFLTNFWMPAPSSKNQTEYSPDANTSVDGEITTIVIIDGGQGYLTTNANVSSFNTACSVLTVDASVDIANLILPNMAVSGNGITANTSIVTVNPINRRINLSFGTSSSGGGTANTLTFGTRVVVSGDGTGAVAIANVSNGSVQNITLTNFGSNYTYADVNVYGTGLGSNSATARAIIGPKYGHGYNSARELGAYNVMIAVKIGDGDTTEGGIISDATSFRQYGLLRNPNKYGQNTAVTSANSNTVISQTTSLTLIAGSNYNIDEFVYQGTESSPTFSGYVESFTSTVVNLTNVKGTVTLGKVLRGVNTNPSGRTVSDVDYPEFEKYTGDILYVENITPITRSPGQAENIKFVVRF